ncbi:MAG: hypothetical protein RIQ56_539 [Candidatus Parcubacteria bacterium]|jgi:sugar-specific transcriptional regulator TrmB
MYTEQLKLAGLSADEAEIYEILLSHGALPASVLARRSKIPRTLTYAILTKLQRLGLVRGGKEKGSVSKFSLTHPFKLQELIRERTRSAEEARNSLDGVMASMISDFNKLSGEQGFRILKGAKGLQELYADVLKERQPIAIIGSPLLVRHPELKPIIEAQVSAQVQRGISARILMPMKHAGYKEKLERDKRRLTTRRFISEDYFSPPAQVLLYGDKMALTTFGENIVTTLIKNKDLHTTGTILFEFIWRFARSEHEKLVHLHAQG